MGGTVWYTSPDGKISIASLSRDRLKETMEVLEKSFLNIENICKVLGIPDDRIAKEDLKNLALEIAEDGISFIALEKAENSKERVVGLALNKFQMNEPGPSLLEKHAACCKSQKTKEVLQLLIDIDQKCNLLDTNKVDCIVEVMFLGILPECVNKKVGTLLGVATVERIVFLQWGLNLKEDLDGKPLPIKPIPKGVAAIYTTEYVRKMWRFLAKKNFYNVAIEIPYKGYVRNGKHYDKFIDISVHEKMGVLYFDFNRVTVHKFDDHFRSNGLAKKEYVAIARRNAFGAVKKSNL